MWRSQMFTNKSRILSAVNFLDMEARNNEVRIFNLTIFSSQFYEKKKYIFASIAEK